MRYDAETGTSVPGSLLDTDLYKVLTASAAARYKTMFAAWLIGP